LRLFLDLQIVFNVILWERIKVYSIQRPDLIDLIILQLRGTSRPGGQFHPIRKIRNNSGHQMSQSNLPAQSDLASFPAGQDSPAARGFAEKGNEESGPGKTAYRASRKFKQHSKTNTQDMT
jgi:hypothetical protein